MSNPGVSAEVEALYDRIVVADGCSYGFDGTMTNVVESGVTVLNLTVAAQRDELASTIRRFEEILAVVDREQGRVTLARSVAEIRRAKTEGKVALLFNFQAGEPIGRRLERLLLFRELGLRSMQLTNNERNFIGDGCTEPQNSGLTPFGREVVRAMNRWGLMIDLSHVGERTSLETLELSEQPCIFSHSNPRARADNPRNLTDQQITLCAQAGGVIGACGWGPICWTGGDKPPDLDDFVGHIEYLVELAGIDHVSIATDAPSSSNLQRTQAEVSERMIHQRASSGAYLDTFGTGLDFRYPINLRDFRPLTSTLLDRGWTHQDVAKVMGGNLLRVWERVWGG